MGWLGDGSHRRQGCQAWTDMQGMKPHHQLAVNYVYHVDDERVAAVSGGHARTRVVVYESETPTALH